MNIIVENILTWYLIMDQNCMEMLKNVLSSCIREYHERNRIRVIFGFGLMRPPEIRKLSEEEFNKLKAIKYNPEIHPQLIDAKCTICSEEYIKDDNIIKLSCGGGGGGEVDADGNNDVSKGHYFHTNCLYEWATIHSARCPLCRTDIKVDV